MAAISARKSRGLRRTRRSWATCSALARARAWSRTKASACALGTPGTRARVPSGGAGSGARRGRKGSRMTAPSFTTSSWVAVRVMLSTSSSRWWRATCRKKRSTSAKRPRACSSTGVSPRGPASRGGRDATSRRARRDCSPSSRTTATSAWGVGPSGRIRRRVSSRRSRSRRSSPKGRAGGVARRATRARTMARC